MARECTFENLCGKLHYKVLTLRAVINELKRTNQRVILSQVFIYSLESYVLYHHFIVI